jgi:hypothetical protein
VSLFPVEPGSFIKHCETVCVLDADRPAYYRARMSDPSPTGDEKKSAPSEFERLAQQPSPGFIAEFFDFLIHNKKWWLTPIAIVLALLGALVLLAGTPAAPFIYTLF